MRFSEFNKINEGGASGAVRYNSEVAIICALLGIDIANFNPAKPELSLPESAFLDSKKVYKDIKNLLTPNFDADKFQSWYDIGVKYAGIIQSKMEENIDKLDWAGGKNQAENAADIGFPGTSVSGISIKAEGGITLANLTPKAVGLDTEKGNDIFYQYAQEEFKEMKTKIFNDVLEIARNQPGVALAPISSKYTITYDSETDKYTCIGKKNLTADANTILASVEKNSPWQRVFGDWFQKNWQSKKSYATPLYTKISVAFEKIIEQTLQKSEYLASILRFSENPYFYISSTGLYYVPSIDQVQDLRLIKLKYGAPDGTSQLFVAEIGRPDSNKYAEFDVYIRYANGMFETNPTVRIQTLKNPQYLGWEKLS